MVTIRTLQPEVKSPYLFDGIETIDRLLISRGKFRKPQFSLTIVSLARTDSLSNRHKSGGTKTTPSASQTSSIRAKLHFDYF